MTSGSAGLRELDIPDGVNAETGAHELVRFWVSDGCDHVALNIGLFDEDKEPAIWGSVAADIVKHAIRGMVQDVPSRSEQVLLAEVEAAFRERLKKETNFSGSLHGTA